MGNKKAVWIIQKIRENPLIFFAFLHAILFLAVSANIDQIVGNCIVERQLAARYLTGKCLTEIS